MVKRILVTPRSFGKTSAVPFEMLEGHQYEIIKNQSGNQYTEEALLEIIEEIDGMIVGLDPVSAEVLKKAKKLKVIAKYGVGMDNIDLTQAKKQGIKVTFTPGANNESVADFSFSLVLGLSRQLVKLDKIVRSKGWSKVIGSEIYGKTIGIIGTGTIGKGVALRAKGFNMNVLLYDIYPDGQFAREHDFKYVDKGTLLKQADIISLHVPLTEEMHHFIDMAELEAMKPTAYVINTARGGIINEAALYHALKNKVIAGAALDVFEAEPPLDSQLLGLDNILLSPHCGAATTDATDRMGIMAAEGIISVLEGLEPKYVYQYE